MDDFLIFFFFAILAWVGLDYFLLDGITTKFVFGTFIDMTTAVGLWLDGFLN